MNTDTIASLREQIAKVWPDALPGEIEMLIAAFSDAPLGMDRREFATRCAKAGLPLSAKTLGKMATTGGGPLTNRFGNRSIITPFNGCLWIAGKLGRAVASTSEAA